MNRKEFIKSCGIACIGGFSLAALLQSCGSGKTITANISGSDLIVPISGFEYVKDEQKRYKKYLIVQNDQLKYPVCVYRFSDTEYSALLMQCTHQGAELQVFGDKLQCPAHGSEFDRKGIAQNAPASVNLRSFPVTVDAGQLKISLK